MLFGFRKGTHKDKRILLGNLVKGTLRGSSKGFFECSLGGAGDLVSKVISRVIIGVAPFRALITLLITYLLSPLPLQASEVARGSHRVQRA